MGFNAQYALKSLIKTSNIAEDIQSKTQTSSYQELIILSSSTNQNPYLYDLLKELSKLFQCSAFSDLHLIIRQLDLFFKRGRK